MDDTSLRLLEMVDRWYHKNTRYHLVDVDPDVMNTLIKDLASYGNQRELKARLDEISAIELASLEAWEYTQKRIVELTKQLEEKTNE